MRENPDARTLALRLQAHARTIQMCCQRRGGGKRILAPHGGELTPPTKREPDGTPLKAAARAWRQQKWLDARDNPHVVNASVHAS